MNYLYTQQTIYIPAPADESGRSVEHFHCLGFNIKQNVYQRDSVFSNKNVSIFIKGPGDDK